VARKKKSASPKKAAARTKRSPPSPTRSARSAGARGGPRARPSGNKTPQQAKGAQKAQQALQRYREKRDFSKTAEPAGESGVLASERLRFVVQKHAARRLHYDLRLELDGVFKSWAVTRGPSNDPKDKRLAVEVEDHPLEYGDFEGTIPAGEYGGGTVLLWDRGYWQPEGSKTAQQALAGGDLKFTLEGKRLKGSWVLVRLRNDRNGGKRNNWLLIKHRDAEAREDGGAELLAQDSSVASGRTLDEIAAGRGRAPRPFMLAGGPARADAVWQSAGPPASGSTPRASAPRRVAPAMRATPLSVKRDAGTPTRRIPDFVEPQLARLFDAPPVGPGWAHEVKFDGYRLQLRVVEGKAQLRTRHALDWTPRFAAIAAAAAGLPDCMLDGEAVAFDRNGHPSFAALQAALAAGQSEQLVLFAFDLLFEGRRDLRALPLAERKAHLAALLERHGSDQIRYVEHFESSGADMLRSACEMGLEGIISKRLDAPYTSGRGDAWRKEKCRAGQEVVLGGWTTEQGTVRSLLAGIYRDGKLEYVGKVGTGFGQEAVSVLLPQLEARTRDVSPFTGPSAPRAKANVRWLEPTLIAEIEFAGWTESGMIRQSAFKGLRQDKDATEVVAERATHALEQAPRAAASRAGRAVAKTEKKPSPPRGGVAKAARAKPAASLAANLAAKREAKPAASPAAKREAKPVVPAARAGAPVVVGVTLSHPDKALWPDGGDGVPVSKLELARYFESVGEWMMPHLEGRPCSLVRAPDGLGGQQFFQRHAMPGMSKLFSMVKVKGDKAPYVQIDRVEALAAVAQIGALELHPWNCVPHDPELAGRLVFDLDPAPDVSFERVIAAALELRERLSAIGLVSFCKTTGGKGLHLVTPLKSGAAHAVEWPAAKNFAHVVCAQMMHDSPAKYLDTMSKSERVGKIFLDYLRNDRTATAVVPLSPRARAGAPVSMPIEWREVKRGLDPKKYTVRSAPAILARSKAWADYAASAQSLKAAIQKLTRA
jgi:bifunctional non-homologous end joining protein LigD